MNNILKFYKHKNKQQLNNIYIDFFIYKLLFYKVVTFYFTEFAHDFY